MLQRVMSQIASVKKDMIILEKSEFSTLLAENEVSVVIIRSFPRLSYVTIYLNGVAGKSFFIISNFLSETQDPVVAAQGAAGCK